MYGMDMSESFSKQSTLTPNYLEGFLLIKIKNTAPIYSLPSVTAFAFIIPKLVITDTI